MFFRLSDQSQGLAFSFGQDSNITANFQVPLATREGEGEEKRRWQGAGGCCSVVLCCWGGEAERGDRTLAELRRSTPGKIHLLFGPQHRQEKMKLVRRGNALRRGMEHTILVFFLDTRSFFHQSAFPQCSWC